MFFIISRLFSFLLTPFIWLFILLIVLLITKNQKRLRKLILIFFCVFIFFSNEFIASEFCGFWEYNITPLDKLSENYDVGIVLGGGMVTIEKRYNRITFRNNTDRIMQAIALYKDGRISKILISSGSGRLFDRYQNEAKLLKPYLIQIGIPSSDILIDTLSDNTRQNALQSAKILDKDFPNGKFLLITSALHMRRAIACFRKVHLNVTPYATNKLVGPGNYTFEKIFVPDVEALQNWSALTHEIFGYVIYAVMGYI